MLTRGHQMDTGGAFPGGYFPNGYDIHAEGVMIPPIKVVDAGVERTDVLELIWNNVRWPEGVKIDNYALMAALQVANDRIIALLDKYGKDEVLDLRRGDDRPDGDARSEASCRPCRTAPGPGESSTDDDGTVLDEQVTVRCDATIKGDELILDFSRSDGLRKGFVNCTYSSTYSRAVAGSFLYFDSALAEFHNEGSMRAGHGHRARGDGGQRDVPGHGRRLARERRHPGAGGDRQRAVQGDARQGHRGLGAPARPLHRGHRSADRRALRPDDHGRGRWRGCGPRLRRLRGRPGHVRPRLHQPRVGGGDRRSGFPWRTVKWHFLPDLSGAGEWRGACGMLWEVENLGGDVGAATGSSDGDLTQPPGALGGQDGPLSRMYIRRGDVETPARTHRMVQVRTGEVLGKVSGGGGGVGDPFRRDPAKVLEDVIDEMTSIDYAREVYGVVVLPGDPPTLDPAATRALRAARG